VRFLNAPLSIDSWMDLVSWIPAHRFLGISATDPRFLTLCAVFVILSLLACSSMWGRFTARPIVFACIYSTPFFLVGFHNFLGDSVQWRDSIHGRYYMSEPGATFIHHWAYRLLHEYFNVGVQSSIAFTSRIAGFLYLLVTARLSLRVLPDADPRSILLFRLAFFAAGVSLLFFGYVENTPLALPAEVLWMLSVVIFLQHPSWWNVIKSGAALALATFIHGRVSFIAPAFACACLIPTGSLWLRIRRAALGGFAYVGILAVVIAYIFLFDSRSILGNPFGNATGGGNRQMFINPEELLKWSHWLELISASLVSGGILVPLGLIGTLRGAIVRRDPVYLWVLSYVIADAIYLGFWEFDFGYFIDWDLIFSGALPLLFATALTIGRAKAPAFLIAPFLAVTAVISLAFGMVVNGTPFSSNITPTASSAAPASICKEKGLLRTYFADSALSNPVGPGESAVPWQEWIWPKVPGPLGSKPFGASYQGYIHVAAAGVHRIFLEATGNVRLIVGEQTLYERWSGFEWKVTAERDIEFPSEGWYPVTLQFYTTINAVPLKLSLESRSVRAHVPTAEELCY